MKNFDKHKKLIIILFLPFLFFNMRLYSKAGISFGPGEIIFGNLEIGQTYDFGKIASQQFEVINKFDSPIDVKIYKFPADTPKQGFEPLPDLNWIEVYPEKLEKLEPGKKYIVSIRVKIPNDEKYLGKNYQFYLQARAETGTGLGIGADARVLLKIKDVVTGEKIDTEKTPAKFEIQPLEIKIPELKIGQDYELSNLTVKNLSERDLSFQIQLLWCEEAQRPLFPGYNEFPGIKTSGAKVNYFTVKPGKKARVFINFYLEKNEKYVGKKYQLFVNVRTYKEDVVQEFYIPIFIEKVSK